MDGVIRRNCRGKHYMHSNSKLFRAVLVAALAVAASCTAFANFAREFGVADLQKMVKELEPFCPRNPDYLYPILCEVEQNPEPNAYATIREQEGKKPQAVMVVQTGILDFVNNDLGMLRAVVAHEMSHLSKGHALDKTRYASDDLYVLYTRQQEYEADVMGASMLQRAGFGKQSMLDLFDLFEKQGRKEIPRIIGMTNDHADPKARAAEITQNPIVLKSLLEYDAGLAMMETRKFEQAVGAFERALAKEPNLKDALVMAGQAALMDYYDRLPGNLTVNYFRPDFGPVIQNPTVSAKAASQATDADRMRYDRAVSTIAKAAAALPANVRVRELSALALVLDPDQTASKLAAGVKEMETLLKSALTVADKVRYTNNIALGLQRQNKLKEASTRLWTLMSSLDSPDAYNPAAAENLGAWPLPSVDKKSAPVLAETLAIWLETSHPGNLNYAKVLKQYREFCTKNGLTAEPDIEGNFGLTRVVSVHVDGNDLVMLMPVTDIVKMLGKAEVFGTYNPSYKEFGEMRWSSGEILIMVDRGQPFRITSYKLGSYVDITPADTFSQDSLRITVGQAVADLKWLPLDELPDINLVRSATVETWKYLPGLGLAVCVEKDKIKGVSVVPFGDYDQQ